MMEVNLAQGKTPKEDKGDIKMNVTILEALQNAINNLNNFKVIGQAIIPLVHEQLSNATILLEKGYSIDDEVEPLLRKHGNVKNVPEKT